MIDTRAGYVNNFQSNQMVLVSGKKEGEPIGYTRLVSTTVIDLEAILDYTLK